MQCNVGGADRVIRIVIGLVLIGLTLTDKIGDWGWIGVLPLVTGVFRFCPAYSIMGCKSCSKDSSCCK
ncbi:DUF2892 domain-containing protein [Polynucleobacter sp. MWH-UH25E]|nr:DUF2892 domain-containing protein [Polynucleobacter sp. MWH-UH25E]QWD62020.1 DUF2892 domain-containing protein [Polynucleobacter sp. MWH-UH25E]